MFLGLPWLNGMNVCGCIAKGLGEVVVLANVAGKHDGGGVDPQEACLVGVATDVGKRL